MISIIMITVSIAMSVLYLAATYLPSNIAGLTLAMTLIIGGGGTVGLCAGIDYKYEGDFRYYKSSIQECTMIVAGLIVAGAGQVYSASPYPFFEVLRYGVLLIGISPIIGMVLEDVWGKKLR